MILQQSSSGILQQLVGLIDKMEQDQYTSPVDALSESSIGSHVRHIIEFYQCLLKGVDSGFVNYDARSRNYLLETDQYFAVTVLLEIIDNINKVRTDKMLMLSMDLTTEDKPVIVDTTFYRELAYNIEHAIHHMAIIKIGLNTAYPTISVEKNFGVAYSTLRYKTQLCAQ
ncbi:MAG TPA: hypothetical protein PKK99_07915 [Bacteroidia bacterium]|nr:hypothetical protein [Bacteroidia bacterium]